MFELKGKVALVTGGGLARVPLKRIGRPEEVSAVVLFLTYEDSSYTAGATFYVDGGCLAT